MFTFSFMSVAELKYHEITGQIIGCAMKVHRYFGPGFPEVIYKRTLVIELEKAHLIYSSEIEREIFTKIGLLEKKD